MNRRLISCILLKWLNGLITRLWMQFLSVFRRIRLIYLFRLSLHLFGCFLRRLPYFRCFGHIRVIAVHGRHCVDRLSGEHRVKHIVEPSHLQSNTKPSIRISIMLHLEIPTSFITVLQHTIFVQFFLKRSHPNARMAPENPNTCESIHAERTAIVFPGLSGDVLYTTFSTMLCQKRNRRTHKIDQKTNMINTGMLFKVVH